MLLGQLAYAFAPANPPYSATPPYAIAEQTVEYLTNPLGVDVSPRFSWKVRLHTHTHTHTHARAHAHAPIHPPTQPPTRLN